jgi:2-methylcitrate dehydratase PrpD
MADSDVEAGFTRWVSEECVAYSIDGDPTSFEWGRHAFLDWLGVTIAGSQEPSARIAADYVRGEARSGPATLIGSADTLPASLATLANGIAAHALDFDDNNSLTGSHPSAPIFSAVVALAEREGAQPAEVIQAAAAGMYAQALVFAALGHSGYLRGFHSTGTLGTFGAAASCARLLDVDAETLQYAFGAAATQAAGLKASFGTMSKHLNAAKAAVNGLLSVDLARRGFTGPTDAIEKRQGFAWTHSDEIAIEKAKDQVKGMPVIRSTIFKFHACCFGTHSAIEGALQLRSRHIFEPKSIESVELRVAPAIQDVCSIPDPTTGLEGKFSLRYATALALLGRSTGVDAFTDAAVQDPEVRAIMGRIEVIPTDVLAFGSSTEVRLRLDSGQVHTATVAVGSGADTDLSAQWDRLVRKFTALAEPVVGGARAEEIVAVVSDIENAESLSEIVRNPVQTS